FPSRLTLIIDVGNLLTVSVPHYETVRGYFGRPRSEAAFGHKLWMEEAINHRHDDGDGHDGDYKHHQAAPCPHFLVVCQSSSASRFTAGAFEFLTLSQCAERCRQLRRAVLTQRVPCERPSWRHTPLGAARPAPSRA